MKGNSEILISYLASLAYVRPRLFITRHIVEISSDHCVLWESSFRRVENNFSPRKTDDMRETLRQCRYVRLRLTKDTAKRVPSLFLAGKLMLQGKYNDKKRRALRVTTRRRRPSLNLHFQHFARRQITTSLRRSSDINDIFDLRRCRRRCRRHSPPFRPVLFVLFVVVIFVLEPSAVFRNS